jgi:hypothetical protein
VRIDVMLLPTTGTTYRIVEVLQLRHALTGVPDARFVVDFGAQAVLAPAIFRTL